MFAFSVGSNIFHVKTKMLSCIAHESADNRRKIMKNSRVQTVKKEKEVEMVGLGKKLQFFTQRDICLSSL